MIIQYFKKFAVIAILGILTSSCEVDGDVNDNTDPDTTESFKDLEVASTFEWKTANDFTLNYQGVPVSSSSAKRPLVIKTQDGKTLRKVNIELSEDVSLDFRVPSSEETIVVDWGTFEKSIALNSNSTIDFTFIEPDTNED